MPFPPARSIAVAALVAMPAACHPVDTWRSITGKDQNDPDPETTANTKNLAAAEAQPYPNLATVPAPPIPAMTQAERDKLTDSLVADRTNARYNEQKLMPGFAPRSEQPPPPPPPAPSSGPAPAPAAGPGPAAGAGAPAGRPPAPGPTASAGGPPAATPPGKASAAPPPRKAGEPPEKGPMESSLQTPTIKEAPQPETTRPPPPPPSPTVAPAPLPARGSMPPTAVASAAPRPPPPPPAISAPAPAPAPAPVPMPASAAPKAVGHTVAAINFSAATANFTAADRVTIDKVAAQFRQKPGTVHIVTYAAAASEGRAQLDNYRAALDRGQAVAKALAEDGVPVGKIETEAAPSRPNAPSGRVEIQLSP